MTWRGFLVTLVLFVALAVDLALVLTEEITPPDPRNVPEAERADPLMAMRFSAGMRHANLVQMGFSDSEADTVVARIQSLVNRWHVGEGDRDLLRARFDASPEAQDVLVSAFCGAGVVLPVRYAALRYLVTEDRGGMRRAVDLDAASAVEFQDWAKAARIDAVYEAAERRDDRPPDATRMALAAILARREEDLLAGRDPWGRGWLRGWSWERVQGVEAGLAERLYEVMALEHLALESAASEGGFCRQ